VYVAEPRPTLSNFHKGQGDNGSEGTNRKQACGPFFRSLDCCFFPPKREDRTFFCSSTRNTNSAVTFFAAPIAESEIIFLISASITIHLGNEASSPGDTRKQKVSPTLYTDSFQILRNAGDFGNPQVLNTFQLIINKRRQLGVLIGNLPRPVPGVSVPKEVETALKQANDLINEIVDLLQKCGELMMGETKAPS